MAGCAALILAGGTGSRLGADTPKQFLPLAGQPVLRRSAAAFLAHPAVDAVRIVHRKADSARYAEATAGLALMAPIVGGATRQDSARLGLESLAEMAPERVLIHDAARPLVDADVISRVVAALDTHGGAVPALPVADTLKRADGSGGRIAATVARDGLWRAQTPQAFRFADILAAHRAHAGEALTDDAAVAEAAGLDVVLVAGSEDNIKITTANDFGRAEAILGARLGSVRVGTGFDVHRFGDGDRVVLCGVEIPHDRGLEGHSDADVALHAVTDAILGAAGAGDIGEHFPPSDPKWRDAASDRFLAFAADAVAALGGIIENVDVTVICQAPRIGPHRAAMRARVAEILSLAPARVNVKATTTEGLGFTGRGEGIAAQASAVIRAPVED